MSEGSGVPLARLLGLFVALYVAGTLATLPLFRFDLQRFRRSELFTKIVYWIPIFGVFMVALYLPNWGRLGVVVWLMVMAGREARVAWYEHSRRGIILAYYGLFCLAVGHFYVLGVLAPARIVGLLITICFGSVLSDVMAFFGGKYLGRHKLPAALNPAKSWEGVAGQLIGSLVGVALVRWWVWPEAPLWLWLPIGAGSAAGDLTNSFVKRRLGTKDWSQAIPGHGGYLDRLASLGGAALLTLYALLLAK